MPAKNPRVKVTIDPELAEALAKVDPRPPSMAGLIRDMALLGARSIDHEARGREEAQRYLLRIARGKIDLDLNAVRTAHKSRGEHLKVKPLD